MTITLMSKDKSVPLIIPPSIRRPPSIIWSHCTTLLKHFCYFKYRTSSNNSTSSSNQNIELCLIFAIIHKGLLRSNEILSSTWKFVHLIQTQSVAHFFSYTEQKATSYFFLTYKTCLDRHRPKKMSYRNRVHVRIQKPKSTWQRWHPLPDSPFTPIPTAQNGHLLPPKELCVVFVPSFSTTLTTVRVRRAF